MKRLATILVLAFSRWGLIAFTIYYATFYIIILNVFPSQFVDFVAQAVNPYYVAIRYVSIAVNIVMCFIVFRFLWKYLQYQSYAIRKKTLSFVMAASLIQLLSFFCYTNIPLESLTNTEQLTNLQQVFFSYKLYIVELVALFFTGYVLAFYIGALSRVKFLTDVMLAPKKR
ncbi:hypothetical protein [Lysinibacillus sp. LZ02]|uniref:hypothetical protein n=1 Tax=Lysinibacillus sp. LZ02 TaxID=3420668 RepID=UPI003D36B414